MVFGSGEWFCEEEVWFKKKVAAPLCYYFSFLVLFFGAKVMCRLEVLIFLFFTLC
jgi:hypothetical protein